MVTVFKANVFKASIAPLTTPLTTPAFALAASAAALLGLHQAVLADDAAGASMQAHSVVKDCADCPDMIMIAPGQFQMGTPDGEIEGRHAAAQLPVHTVTITTGFAVGRSEVTVAQYAAFIAATGYKSPARGCQHLINGGWAVGPKLSWEDPGFAITGDHAAACIAVDDARTYAAWLSEKTGRRYRLPSEAEWEYAARAGTATPAFWPGTWADACKYQNGGDESMSRAVDGVLPTKETTPCDDGYAFTSPAGAFAPNAWGLVDVAGNVAEWVDDCFTTDLEKIPTDGSSYHPDKCNTAVMKGGSWAGHPGLLRSGSRLRGVPGRAGSGFGFRVARDLE